MPKIAEIREIDGEVWCRIGAPDAFPSGTALWSPEEQQQNYKQGYRDGSDDAKQTPEQIKALNSEIARAEEGARIDQEINGVWGAGWPDGYADGLRKAKEIMGVTE